MLLVVSVIVASRWLTNAASDPAGPALLAVAYGCAALLSIPLVLETSGWRIGRPIVTAAMITALYGGVLIADPMTRSLTPALPALALTVLLISLNMVVLTRVVPRSLLCALFAALVMLPVWAGPLVELAGNPAWARNLVLGASPLTVLSLPLDLDYLRTTWFYAHSPLGSMRYDYPSWFTLCAVYALVPAAVLARFVMTTVDPTPFRHPEEAHT
ncbi:MAG: hypothetical protein P8172_15450 [Gammaproteobacteria bacterium]